MAANEILASDPPSVRAEYTFRQRFRVPAPWAFRWCIDYTPHDWEGSGESGSRKVVWLSPETVLLDDEFPSRGGRRIRKVKMVQIYRRARYWVSTHIIGPAHYSQFRYTIVADGPKASFLVFEGRDLRWQGRPLSPSSSRKFTEQLRTEDAALWKRFATQMERDYSQG